MARDQPPRLDGKSVRRSRMRGTIANVLTSALLGTVSLLVAWFAFQASTYGDEAARLASIANQMGVESVRASQEDFAMHLFDLEIWVAIEQSGVPLGESELVGMLSDSWLAAVDRSEIAHPEATGLVLDDRYWVEVFAESEASRLAQKGTAEQARDMGATNSRLTGATVIFSAALLLLTIASSGARSPGVRISLASAASAILVIALLIGWAPVRFPAGFPF